MIKTLSDKNMSKKDFALKLIDKYGIEKFSSSLSDSDYITRFVKKPFGFKKEILFFSDEYANQIFSRYSLNVILDKSISIHKSHKELFRSLKNEMEIIYHKKLDTSFFNTFCDELLIYMSTTKITQKSNLNDDEIDKLKSFYNHFHEFHTSQETLKHEKEYEL